MPRNQLTQVVITLQETVAIVNPEVGVMADLKTSMDHQVMLHQVATIPSLQTVPITVFRITRSKLTIWKELGLPNFCQEVVNGLNVHLLPNFKPMPNPIPFSIPEGPKSDCITKEVQDLLLDDAIEQVLPNCYSNRVFYSNVFTVPKPGTNLHRPVLYLKRLNTYINNQSFKMEGIKNLPSMVKQGYYMVKLDIQPREDATAVKTKKTSRRSVYDDEVYSTKLSVKCIVDTTDSIRCPVINAKEQRMSHNGVDVDSSGNNTTGNSSNSKSSSGSNGRSNNFNGSPSNVASGSNNTKSANGTNKCFQKNKK
ncbi:hypothetical protein ACTFIR_012809 [Dictyostelium discoideum]